jgi:hypothetical protein
MRVLTGVGPADDVPLPVKFAFTCIQKLFTVPVAAVRFADTYTGITVTPTGMSIFASGDPDVNAVLPVIEVVPDPNVAVNTRPSNPNAFAHGISINAPSLIHLKFATIEPSNTRPTFCCCTAHGFNDGAGYCCANAITGIHIINATNNNFFILILLVYLL